MMLRQQYSEPAVMLVTLIRWFYLASGTGVVVGVGTSLFLQALFYATNHTSHLSIFIRMLLLPVGGLLNGLILYYGYGREAKRKSDSYIAALHENNGRMPMSTAWIKPLASIITLASGGSAGKEGPCAHIGGTLASWLAQVIHAKPEVRRRIVICGISAGFASVFGTPMAGAIYGIEVLTIGQLRYDSLFSSLVAGFTSYEVSRWIGIPYSYYDYKHLVPYSEWLFVKVVALGIVCGLVSWLFIEMLEQCKGLFRRTSSQFHLWAPLVPLMGGILLAVLLWFTSPDYLGLGLPLMDHALHGEHIPFWAFFWKILFVAITLGSGFYGGIVTPQFVIGAVAGNAFSSFFGIDPVLGAAIGMAAVMASSSNTPIAAIVMGFEVFGSSAGVYVLAACISAYLMVGHRSVYPDQRVAYAKSLLLRMTPGIPLNEEHIHVSLSVLRRMRKLRVRKLRARKLQPRRGKMS